MNAAGVVLLLLFAGASAARSNNNDSLYETDDCATRTLSEPRVPTGLDFDVSLCVNELLTKLSRNASNLLLVSDELFRARSQIVGVFLSPSAQAPALAFNIRGRIKLLRNRTSATDLFWKVFYSSAAGWAPPIKDCYFFPGIWLYSYVVKTTTVGVALFLPMKVDQCDDYFAKFMGRPHQCDKKSTVCVPQYEHGDKRGGYRCKCLEGYYHPEANFNWKGFSGEDIENGFIDSHGCVPCPTKCGACESGGVCTAKRDIQLRTVILSVQVACMAVTVVIALVVFKQRKCKTIASGMWTILETILLGVFLLYSVVIIRFFEPSTIQCLLEPWARELGFIICYGAIILKLYRHLIEFRTRKAHRWVVKDTDLLKYLFIMTLSVLAYMAAYTSISLNFMRENYSLLYMGETADGVHYEACKPLWWDYVTEIGEIAILIFGIHLSYASRNAKTQFHERRFLCASISLELAMSTIFYAARIFFLPRLHPDYVLVAYFLRTHFTTTLTLLLLFAPKFWYQQKQVRSLAQDFSCRIPVDAFKDANAHGPLTGNNSDVDVGEVTLADMSPDDIRAELKRLYMQLEVFKNKTICRDNPHISKRRGGRKAQHRRFSLQNLYGKHRVQKQQIEQEVTEAEPSRTPEDSVCSTEGASAIYNDLPSTHVSDHRQ